MIKPGPVPSCNDPMPFQIGRKEVKCNFFRPKGEGMFSTITRKVQNELMSFKHLGSVKDFKEQPVDEETKMGWLYGNLYS